MTHGTLNFAGLVFLTAILSFVAAMATGVVTMVVQEIIAWTKTLNKHTTSNNSSRSNSNNSNNSNNNNISRSNNSNSSRHQTRASFTTKTSPRSKDSKLRQLVQHHRQQIGWLSRILLTASVSAAASAWTTYSLWSNYSDNEPADATTKVIFTILAGVFGFAFALLTSSVFVDRPTLSSQSEPTQGHPFTAFTQFNQTQRR